MFSGYSGTCIWGNILLGQCNLQLISVNNEGRGSYFWRSTFLIMGFMVMIYIYSPSQQLSQIDDSYCIFSFSRWFDLDVLQSKPWKWPAMAVFGVEWAVRLSFWTSTRCARWRASRQSRTRRTSRIAPLSPIWCAARSGYGVRVGMPTLCSCGIQRRSVGGPPFCPCESPGHGHCKTQLWPSTETCLWMFHENCTATVVQMDLHRLPLLANGFL